MSGARTAAASHLPLVKRLATLGFFALLAALMGIRMFDSMKQSITDAAHNAADDAADCWGRYRWVVIAAVSAGAVTGFLTGMVVG